MRAPLLLNATDVDMLARKIRPALFASVPLRPHDRSPINNLEGSRKSTWNPRRKTDRVEKMKHPQDWGQPMYPPLQRHEAEVCTVKVSNLNDANLLIR
jgi:hypothetical protein